MRVVKHIGARSTPVDDQKVLLAIPTFPGEKIKNIHLSAYLASGDASAIDQPGECNWYGISLPWSLVFISNALHGGGPIGDLGSVPDIDSLFTQYLVGAQETAGEVFGGDVDIDADTDTDSDGPNERALIDSGPIGVTKWFNREVIMAPFAAEGNTVIRFGDSFSANTGPIAAHAFGALHLFGVVRFVATAETNFNIELDDTVSLAMMSLLIAGDYTKVMSRVENDTSSSGDYLRTVLFGGDQFVEADTLKGPAAKATVKAVINIDSRMSRVHL